MPALSIAIGVTAATPEVWATSCSSVFKRGSPVPSAGAPSETATINGPLTPGPKFFEIRS